MHEAAERALPDGARLARWFEEVGVEVGGPLDLELLAGGRSNLTFRVTDGRSTWVLRRPPLGHVLATAHDMRREWTVLRAVGQTGIAVPAVTGLCEDESVIGAPFLVMAFVEGRVVADARQADGLSRAEAGEAGRALVEQLAAIHAVDPATIGLAAFGRPDGFMRRQLRRWQQQWEASSTSHTHGRLVRSIATALDLSLPASSPVALLHGDYRLGNVILDAADAGKIAAVIDWEMSTLGDPGADLGLLLAYWHPAAAHVTAGGSPTTGNRGFPSAEEVAERYCALTGLDPAILDVYRCFGFFKLAVIAQTIVARHRQALAIGEDLDSVAGAVEELLDAAGTSAATLRRQTTSEVIA